MLCIPLYHIRRYLSIPFLDFFHKVFHKNKNRTSRTTAFAEHCRRGTLLLNVAKYILCDIWQQRTAGAARAKKRIASTAREKVALLARRTAGAAHCWQQRRWRGNGRRTATDVANSTVPLPQQHCRVANSTVPLLARHEQRAATTLLHCWRGTGGARQQHCRVANSAVALPQKNASHRRRTK